MDTTLAELVDTRRLSHEHDLELLAVRVVVDVLCQLGVDCVRLDGDVNSDSALKVNDVLLQGLYLGLKVAHLLQQLQARLVRLEALLLKLHDVVCGRLHLPMELVFVVEKAFVLGLERVIFLKKRKRKELGD